MQHAGSKQLSSQVPLGPSPLHDCVQQRWEGELAPTTAKRHMQRSTMMPKERMARLCTNSLSVEKIGESPTLSVP